VILDIKTFPDKVLRGKAEIVDKIDDEIRQLLSDMTETMYAAPGIGLAAPQVGVLKRVIVIDVTAGEEPGHLLKLINPEIINAEGEVIAEEGCLSIPGEFEIVCRNESVKVKAFNEDAEEILVEAEGLLSRALQHEIDHLNGTLFLDRLSGLKKEGLKKRIKKRINAGDYVVTGE